MRFHPLEDIGSAFHSLKSTKTRTLLTVTGVAIGVASITAILSLSSGVTNLVNNQIGQMGGAIAVIRPGVPTNVSGDSLSGAISQQQYVTSTLTEKDLTDIGQIDGVASAAPIMIVTGIPTVGSNAVKNSVIVASTPALATINNFPVRDGQFIDSVTNRDTAVIGSKLSVDLFGTDQSIGQTFTIQGSRFTVIGILKDMNSPINFNNVDFDHAAIVSLESGKSFNQGIVQIQQIDLQAKDPGQLAGVLDKVKHTIMANHHGDEDFTILSGDAIAHPTSKFYDSVSSVMAIIAGISLVVGGIGIMNIMLVSVAERTREIGLRKSVGASSGNIVWQFMIESLIISLIGGVIGYLAGYALAFLVSTTLTFGPAFTWQIAAIALGVSIVVGVLFGIYPALRAARKDPIEALRQFH
ncbi:MAG TPA: ABC transporter permease [Candidatus Saccharimonadales bacterium]|nr:ABC transporter permease [Candidatus Saccharimonadales bacterium]